MREGGSDLHSRWNRETCKRCMAADQGSRLSLNGNDAGDDAFWITTFAITGLLKVVCEVANPRLKRCYPFDDLALMCIGVPQTFKIAVQNNLLEVRTFILQLNEFVGT